MMVTKQHPLFEGITSVVLVTGSNRSSSMGELSSCVFAGHLVLLAARLCWPSGFEPHLALKSVCF
jgi:hypothetical protein